ncbi:hypothetical protein VFPFJ_02013 [Purpureocillium lilacinum]|uniref:Uncharacterized protein n=1 Tax=Purpureocillium lilacinum TaxID=33203 RepID=A0A179HSL2_PURLI|nr:hypothetical protein VFPFJ_02013 [Purpureocillium lilacinum]OAQ92852.1 hypothetical protein VFPFJ_02013 [Purpureocillium lilacinum]
MSGREGASRTRGGQTVEARVSASRIQIQGRAPRAGSGDKMPFQLPPAGAPDTPDPWSVMPTAGRPSVKLAPNIERGLRHPIQLTGHMCALSIGVGIRECVVGPQTGASYITRSPGAAVPVVECCQGVILLDLLLPPLFMHAQRSPCLMFRAGWRLLTDAIVQDAHK